MANSISLVIPTHNRHRYLDRILRYYQSSPFPIYIADSTEQPYVFAEKPDRCTYLHLPGKTLTQKLSLVLGQVNTPYVFMCADDDFTIVNSVNACVAFLEKHPDYSVCMGNCICYRKESVPAGNVQFAAMYTEQLSFEIAEEDPFDRLRHHFTNYRTFFYGVHRTENLELAYEPASEVITNLFLNEYLVGVVVALKGKLSQPPLLYQVREYADDSGDKTTTNLDSIITGAQYENDYKNFLELVSSLAAKVTGRNISYCRSQIHNIFVAFAAKQQQERSVVAVDTTKKIGSIIRRIPVVGKAAIQMFRNNKRKRQVELFVKLPADKQELQRIGETIAVHKEMIR